MPLSLQQHACSNFQVKSDVAAPSSKRADPRVQKRMVKEARIVTIEPPQTDPSRLQENLKSNEKGRYLHDVRNIFMTFKPSVPHINSTIQPNLLALLPNVSFFG